MRIFLLILTFSLLFTSAYSFASDDKNSKKCQSFLLDGTESLTKETAPLAWDSAIRRASRNLNIPREDAEAKIQIKQGMPKIYLLDESFITLDEEKIRASIKNPVRSVWIGTFKGEENKELFYNDLEFEDGEYKTIETMFPKFSFNFGQKINDVKSIYGADKVLAQVEVIAPLYEGATNYYLFLICEKAGSLYTYFVPNPFIKNQVLEGILDNKLHPFSEFNEYFTRRYLARIPHPIENQN